MRTLLYLRIFFFKLLSAFQYIKIVDYLICLKHQTSMGWKCILVIFFTNCIEEAPHDNEKWRQ